MFEIDAACGDEPVLRRVSTGRAVGPGARVHEDALGTSGRQVIGTNATPFDQLRQAVPLHRLSMVAARRPDVPKMGGHRGV